MVVINCPLHVREHASIRKSLKYRDSSVFPGNSVLPFSAVAPHIWDPSLFLPLESRFLWRSAFLSSSSRSHLRKKGRRTVIAAENSQVSWGDLPSRFPCSLGRPSGIRGPLRGFL